MAQCATEGEPLPTDSEYIERISALDRAGLLALWELIEGDTSGADGWEPGKAFEYLVLRAFQIEGASVSWPYSVRIFETVAEQIDGAVCTDGLHCLVESKDYQRPVNIEPVAKLRNQLSRRPAGSLGLLFSRNGFTEPARLLTQFLAPQTILLWDGAEVQFALEHERMSEGLRLKYRYAVEHAVPDHNLLAEA